MDGAIVEIVLRRARLEDREKAFEVESKAMPNYRYLPNVFDMFVSDESGEFSVAELDGEIVGCGKYTLVPDGSAWLETLRVIPERQGIGIGKRFYERFFDNARRQGVKTMRMYTSVTNAVSKGLAERYGFWLVATYKSTWLNCQSGATRALTGAFRQVTDPERATALLMPFREKWTGFLVINRTFYSLSPALCTNLAENGMVYEDTTSHSVITLGARFMPEQALHIGIFGGDAEACLRFAMQKGIERGVERLSCLFPPSAADIQNALTQYGFRFEDTEYIVMEVQLRD